MTVHLAFHPLDDTPSEQLGEAVADHWSEEDELGHPSRCVDDDDELGPVHRSGSVVSRRLLADELWPGSGDRVKEAQSAQTLGRQVRVKDFIDRIGLATRLARAVLISVRRALWSRSAVLVATRAHPSSLPCATRITIAGSAPVGNGPAVVRSAWPAGSS